MLQEPLPIPSRTRVDRLEVSLACRLDTGETQHSGTVVNVSYGGFGIELESDAETIEILAPHTVVIDDLGAFEVDTRWRRGRRVGLRFSDEIDAVERVQEFLNANALEIPRSRRNRAATDGSGRTIRRF